MNKKSAALLASMLAIPMLVLGLTMKDVSAGPEGQPTYPREPESVLRQVEPPTRMAEPAIDEGMSEDASQLSAEPQVNCRIDNIFGIRWTKWYPEFKYGDCASTGLGCEDCIAKCRHQFTFAGKWKIKSHGPTQCPI
jgi:hypothetical protein